MINDNDRIIVVDSYCGSGKTSWAIDYINQLQEDTKIIYITPYLDEVARILSSCKSKEFCQPDRQSGQGSKLNHLISLIKKGRNIVSTHALFSNITDQLINILRANNYILFLDEVFQTVERYDLIDGRIEKEIKEAITKQDVVTLLEQGHIKIEEDFRVTWIDPDRPLSKYSPFINLCQRDLIYFINGNLLLWTFPIEVFREGVFDRIFILTYQFDAQLQAYYYKYFEVPYAKYYASKENGKFTILPGDGSENERKWIETIRTKINIVEDKKLNKPGDVYFSSKNVPFKSALSKTYYSNNPQINDVMRKNLINFFQNVCKSKANERMWTCFEEDKSSIKSNISGVKSWLACNARATNKYNDRTCLAYLVNRYIDPFYQDFFEYKGIKIDQDQYALSELIQWIWRSAIRDGKSINLYIPSSRMRNLLKKYLESEPAIFVRNLK